MGLLSAIAKEKPTIPFDKVAQCLADSDLDLTDFDIVTTWLVEHGFKPWNIVPPEDGRRVTDTNILCEAWNIRTMRVYRDRALPYTKLPEDPR